MLTEIDPVKGLKLDFKYGDIPVTSKGVRLNQSQVVSAPSVQVCPIACPSFEHNTTDVILVSLYWERRPDTCS